LPATAGKQHWGNLPGAALSLAIAEAANSAKRFTLLLTADSQSAERLEQELSFFAPELPVLHFPDWETLPYDLFSPHQDINVLAAPGHHLPANRRAVPPAGAQARHSGRADHHGAASPRAHTLSAR